MSRRVLSARYLPRPALLARWAARACPHPYGVSFSLSCEEASLAFGRQKGGGTAPVQMSLPVPSFFFFIGMVSAAPRLSHPCGWVGRYLGVRAGSTNPELVHTPSEPAARQEGLWSPRRAVWIHWRRGRRGYTSRAHTGCLCLIYIRRVQLWVGEVEELLLLLLVSFLPTESLPSPCCLAGQPEPAARRSILFVPVPSKTWLCRHGWRSLRAS